MRSIAKALALLALVLTASPAHAETQTQLKGRIIRALQVPGAQNAGFIYDKAILVRLFDTAANLTADTDEPDGTIGYALDTDVFYFMTAGSWVAISSLASMANGATITNAVDGTVVLNEGGEDLTIAVTSNLLTLASTTGATYAFTPAVAIAGDLTLSGGAGALTFGAASSSVVTTDNSTTGLIVGATGETSMLTLDTTDDAEQVIVAATTGFRSNYTEITGVTALDASDCGKRFSVTAAADGDQITLPDADAVPGCEVSFHYVGADGGALVDISPLDSDADGIEGGCYETTTDTVVYFSGTADADVGLTKATILTGDWIGMYACGAAMWCITGCQGIAANN